MTFKIGEWEYQHEFVLADITRYALLGLDFFEQIECGINFVQHSLYILRDLL